MSGEKEWLQREYERQEELKIKIFTIPPGATLAEQIKSRGITVKDLADQLGFSEKQVMGIINGEVSITSEIALKLEDVLGIPASFWNNLEAIYRESLTKEERCKQKTNK